MRTMLVATLLGVLANTAAAQKPETLGNRHGVEVDFDGFPQSTPQEALRSVLKAADAGRFDYLIAQLADPPGMDQRIKDAGSFAKFLDTVKNKWRDDPENAKELRKYSSEGTWEQTAETATAKHPDIKGRQVFFKKIGNRWYLENRQKAQP